MRGSPRYKTNRAQKQKERKSKTKRVQKLYLGEACAGVVRAGSRLEGREGGRRKRRGEEVEEDRRGRRVVCSRGCHGSCLIGLGVGVQGVGFTVWKRV